ncbi:MAG: DUF4278 domain-containing protein [Cyanobacteria bacterium J06641_5]
MKYRGQEYNKANVQLNTTVESEIGKYRGVTVRYTDVKAAVPHAAGHRKYRGVSF